MNEAILQYWNRMKQYWNQLTNTKKIIVVAIIVLTLTAIPLIIYSFSKTEYALAYTDLQASDAAAIQKYLVDAKIPYNLSADGKSIEVPRDQAAQVKINVEDQRLNQTGSIGYGGFNGNTFGTTDNEFQMKKLNAIQGEMQQVINSITPISSSKVLINLKEESLFLRTGETQAQSTASVVVQIKPGYVLDQQKIDTMYNLVSKGVKDLPIANITISDQYGNPLDYSKNGSSASAAGIATEQFTVKKQFELEIQKKVMSILGVILGPENVIPMAVATMNFDKKVTSERLVRPVVDNEGLIISLQEIQKSYTSDGGSSGGIAGTGDSDVPGYPGTTSSGKTSSEEVQRTVNNEVDRIANEIQSSPFTLVDLAISVGIEPPDINNPASLTQATKDAVQKMLVNIISASLANSGRTFTNEELINKVTVFESTFAGKGGVDSAGGTNWTLLGGLGLLAVALAGIGGFVLSRRRKAREEELVEPPQPEVQTIDFETVTNENQVRKQLETLAKKKPDEFVNLLRTWLVDE